MFDPNIPADHAELTGAMFRGQFNGLKALMDAIAAINAATVDSTTTLPAGSPAQASVSITGNTLHFTFQIPEGTAGAQGPAFANAVVDGVTTLNPGDPATVGVTFDGTNVRFTFGIPQGQPGQNGEVTEAVMNSAISGTVGGAVAGTSNNSNSVATLDTVFPDPAMGEMRAKLNELINALRR